MEQVNKRYREEFDTKEKYDRYKIKSIEDKQEEIIDWINETGENGRVAERVEEIITLARKSKTTENFRHLLEHWIKQNQCLILEDWFKQIGV